MLDGSSRWPRPSVLAAIYLPPVMILVFSVILHVVKGVDFGAISRDPVAQDGEYPLAGAQSTIGGLVWITGATVGFIGVLLLVRMGEARLQRTQFLGALSLFTLVMGIDDTFLLHDGLGPLYLGIDERPFMLLYGTAAIAIAWSFRKVIMRLDPVLLALGLALFVGSLAVDHFQEMLEGHAYRIFYEDGFKLLGIFGWAGYLVRQTWLVVVDLAERNASPAEEPAAQGRPDRFPRPAETAPAERELPLDRHFEHAFDQPFDQRFGRALKNPPGRSLHPLDTGPESAYDHPFEPAAVHPAGWAPAPPVHHQATNPAVGPGFPRWPGRPSHDPDAHHDGYPGTPRDGYPDVRHNGYPDARENGYPDARQNGYPDARNNGYLNAHHNGYPDADRRSEGFNRFLDDFHTPSPDQVASMARHRRASEDRRSAEDWDPNA